MINKGFYGYTSRDYKKAKRKRKKCDWHRNEFNNPYFVHHAPINLKFYLYFFFFVFLAVPLFYFLLFSKYLQISSITINSKNQLYNEKINSIIRTYLDSKQFQFLSSSNYFIFNSEDIKNEISNQFLVKNLELSKTIPNKIEINFESIIPLYIWVQNGKYYNIDEKGMVMEELVSLQSSNTPQGDATTFDLGQIKTFLMNSTSNIDLPIIYNESDQDLKIKDYINNKDVFNLISNINSKILSKINTDIILYKINLSDNFKKIEVVTESGWSIYLSDDDIENQIKNLYSLMETTFKDSQPSEYIDLRYRNKLYYK